MILPQRRKDAKGAELGGFELVAAVVLAAVMGVLAWLVCGCAGPQDGPGLRPWEGPTPIRPPSWTNQVPEEESHAKPQSREGWDGGNGG